MLCKSGGAFGSADGLVVTGRVEGELAEGFAGGRVEDADVEAFDDEQDAGAFVDAADADVVEFPVVAQGDRPGFVDGVGADAAWSGGCGEVAGGLWAWWCRSRRGWRDAGATGGARARCIRCRRRR